MSEDGEAVEELAAAVEHLKRAGEKAGSEEVETEVRNALDDLDDSLLQCLNHIGEIHDSG